MRSALFIAIVAASLSSAQPVITLLPAGTPNAPPQPNANSDPNAAKPEEKKEPAKLEGQVSNATTGERVKRVNIMLMPAEPQRGTDFVPLSTMTDAEGKFAMTEIPPGKYRLWAERTGFVRTEYGARGASQMGATINLSPGQEMKQLQFRLQPHAVITGRVTDEEGEPLANVMVQTMTYRYMPNGRQLFPSGSASTNDLGEYRIFGLPGGRYYLSATFHNSGMMGGVDRTAPGTKVEQGFAPAYYPGTNDPKTAMQIQVPAGRTLTNMDIRLSRTKTVRVTGRITNLNPNSPPSMVMLLPQGSSFFGMNRLSNIAGKEGKFEIRGVTPGSYNLLVQGFDGQERQVARVPVEVGTSNIEGLEVALQSGQDVTGTIKVEGDEQVNVSSVRILLQPKDNYPMFNASFPVTKDDGTFLIKNVTPDAYNLRVGGLQNQVYLKSVYNGSQDVKNAEITILPGASPILSVVVSTAGGQVSGTVKGDKDKPASGAMVVLVPDAPLREDQAKYKVASSDQNGSFSISAIPPGQYKLFAWEGAEMGQWTDPEFLQTWESKGKTVVFKEKSKETADLTLSTVEGGAGSAAR